MKTEEVLHLIKDVIDEVRNEEVFMEDRRPEIKIAAQFAAVKMFQRLDAKYNFRSLDSGS